MNYKLDLLATPGLSKFRTAIIGRDETTGGGRATGRLSAGMPNHGMTAVVTGEKGEASITRCGPKRDVADFVITLDCAAPAGLIFFILKNVSEHRTKAEAVSPTPSGV